MKTKTQHLRALNAQVSSIKTPLAVVSWKSRITRTIGHGQPIATASAIEAVRQGERDFPELDHWIEEHPTTTAP